MAEEINVTPFIKEIGRGAKGARDLEQEQARQLFGAMLDGKVPDLQLGALVLGLRIKSESDEELRGFKQALDERTPRIALPSGKATCAVIPTYNGARRQLNLMPLVAQLLVRAGLPVLIHGRHDFDTRTDPSELMSALDIPRARSVAQAESLLADGGIAFIGLADLCPRLDRLLALRPQLGLRNSGHTLAKLIDPCPGHSLRLVAVTHPEYLAKMRAFLAADGGRALLMRGTEGEAYANPRRRPLLECFIDSVHEIAYPAAEGGAPPVDTLPDTPETGANVEAIRRMLSGSLPIPQPILDEVQACLWAAGLADRPGQMESRASPPA